MLRSILATGLLAALAAHAQEHQHQHPHEGKAAKAASARETAFGRAGDPKKAARTIDIVMSDKMRFTPVALTVKQGETVRFRVKNSGQTMHEMVLGTMQELKAHAEMMQKHPGMEHEEAWMMHVAPGKTETMLWQFTKAGDFHYGCLVPGHFEAGMIGKVKVMPRDALTPKH